MRLIRFIVAWCALFAGGGLSAALVTLTNLNALYFRVDADPTAVVTNVVLLSGNLTNWFKLSTNVIVLVNPTSTYVPYNNAGAFDDSWFYRIANGMGIDTNLYFGPGTTNVIYRSGNNIVYTNGGTVVSMVISNGAGNWVTLGANSGDVAELTGPAAVKITWTSGTPKYVQFWEHRIHPLVSGIDLGGDTSVSPMTPFSDLNLDGNYYHYGYMLSSTNYSRLNIYHSGTNEWIHIDSESSGSAGSARPVVIGIGSTTNAFRVSETMWDDSMVPEALVKVGATAPTQASFNGGPGQTLQFQNNRDDSVTASVQISHRYRQGTSIYPHVHWAETAATGAGTNVVWELQYTWANPDTGVFPLYNTLLMTNSVSGTNWLHSMESFPAISGTGKQVSAIMVFQLRRLANSATADDYDQNVAFLGFDLHYQVDSPGSDSAISKSF